MSDTTVTAVIPTIPPRRRLLLRAVASVRYQTRPVDEIITPTDTESRGAAYNRNQGIWQASSEWVAFLDDDDIWLPHHIERLLMAADETGADIVYPWFQGVTQDGLGTRLNGQIVDPFRVPFGEEQAEYLRKEGNFIPVTLIARTSLLRDVGGFSMAPWASADNPCEDWGCWIKLVDAGARFYHLPEITWRWNGHQQHTSGRNWTDIYDKTPAAAGRH